MGFRYGGEGKRPMNRRYVYGAVPAIPRLACAGSRHREEGSHPGTATAKPAGRSVPHESIRRWTRPRALAFEEPCALAEERFQVGYTDGWRSIILGFGVTWEEAFGLADQTPIDTSEESWWGPHPHGIQQRHASWCRAGASCTCSSIRRTHAEEQCLVTAGAVAQPIELR